MSKFITKARGYFRKKKIQSVATEGMENCGSPAVLTKRIGALSKKMAKLKIQLHDVSLAYLQMVQGRIREKIGRSRQRRQPIVERRKLGTLALRMKSTANRMLNRVKGGEVLSFPGAEESSAIKDPNA